MKKPGPVRRGTQLAPGYPVIARLSRGRTLDVYDVWSNERRCRCIAKTLRPDRWADARARRRLAREGRLLQRLTHPHIVRGYETLSSERLVVIMETLSGETLAHLIHRRTRRLSAVELAQLGLHLSSALGYLHDQGVLHLDLKPSNIVAERGRAKLIDLSIARAPGIVRKGIGTWCYMAPEQARGGAVGSAADVWGLGAVLFEAASGVSAFGEDDDGPEYPQLERRAEPVGRHRRLPTRLREAIDGSLEPEPERRPTLGELVAALEHG